MAISPAIANPIPKIIAVALLDTSFVAPTLKPKKKRQNQNNMNINTIAIILYTSIFLY
jgi:hypothetical protein